MKNLQIVLFFFLLIISRSAGAQNENPIIKFLPKGTVLYQNVSYANDTLIRHQLDVYIPSTQKGSYPVVVWLHGGGWRKGDKYSAMDYMGTTAREMIEKGYAIVSANYRYSSTDQFPAQIQDCNQVLTYITGNASKYHLDVNRIALIGFSAGGHLAALLGLSNNNKVGRFYADGNIQQCNIKLVFDYYGISNLETLTGPGTTDPNSGVQLLIGAKAAEQPQKAKEASPVNYIDQNDPPFFIVHGDKDQAVDHSQSVELSTKLNEAHVKNELLLLPGAPHGGPFFDTPAVRAKLFRYLERYLK
ncbi:alpha/beta hydrolase [Mucilaginibacter conchicola]|uniref:Alpha/beta hydrolase n=1 Tax=Mucilaginibacter conchicola TaxID=2303333 RepID=A0A372NUB0_9SPHI|nr:alpha/beta hydrolase [Mucilaginibacter conchicola]RFZ92702.1 alpha/beta hydrolase [Mucilaginibacter conchicola]